LIGLSATEFDQTLEAETKKDAIGVFFDSVKQIRTPLANHLARLRLSPLGSAQSHPVSRFDGANLMKAA
jgi:hypothetical protein